MIDRTALDARLDAAWTESGENPDNAAFGVLLRAVLRETLDEAEAGIKARFMANNDGSEAVLATAVLMDAIISAAYKTITRRMYRAPNPTRAEQICLIAVGGYGRGEMAPCSDLDLLFLLPYKSSPHVEQVVEAMLYLLWDLRLKVGHATRSIDECLRLATSDMMIRTTILEARFLIGEQALMDELMGRFRAEIMSGDPLPFVEAKLKESEERHHRLGDSRYVIEPNIKDGKGGLRDLHRLFWIARHVYQAARPAALVAKGVLTRTEARRFARAERFLWTIRCHLHYLAGRAEERLTIGWQPEISARLGYADRAGLAAVERFMKHYYLTAKDVGDLTRLFCAAIEADHQRPPRLKLSGRRGRDRGPEQDRAQDREQEWEDFRLDAGRLTLARDDAFRRDPVNLIRMFHIAQRDELDFHPHILRLVTQNLGRVDASLRADPEANRLFLEILTSAKGPERVLRAMNEARLFGRFVPDFGRVVAQMQYDMYHVYTVDEHTIIMLGVLFALEGGTLADAAPVASEIIHTLRSRRALYVAALLHDIAKGRGGDHSILGEKIARRLCPRFGMSAEETETVAWLVRWHLLMSYAAFKRDISDPQTIHDFAAIVQSPERLRLLLVLTVADIRAVGPTVWNGWKAALLRDLYWRAAEELSGESPAEDAMVRAEAVRQTLRGDLANWSDEAFRAYAERGRLSYWLAHDRETLARHAQLLRAAADRGDTLTVDLRVDTGRAVSELTIYTADHPGLFSRIAGAVAALGANIVEARITTMADGMALDMFRIQDQSGGAFDPPNAEARLSVAIEKALSGTLNPAQEIARRDGTHGGTQKRAGRNTMTVPPRVLIDNHASAGHTVIEVNGTDRPGLLYRVTGRLADQGLQISSAKISTWGVGIVDVFYVKDLFGLKIESAQKLAAIRDSVMAELDDADAPPPA